LGLPESFATSVDTPLTIPLEAFDVEGDPLYYYGEILDSNPDLSIAIDQNAGLVEITPSNGLLGDFTVQVGVRQQDSPFDTETFTVSIQIPEPSSVVLLGIGALGVAVIRGRHDAV